MTLSQADIDSLLGPQPADSVESLLDAPLTGEDISLAMQDPAFTPTQADYLKYEEYAKTKQTDWINTIAQSVDAAANMIGGAISEGAQGAVINPLNYIEGAAQGTRQLYGLVAQSQDPSSPLFKFKDLVAGSGTAQSRYEQFLEARDFANRSARLESGQDFLAIQPEFTNPEFVQGVSMILDPTLALPGIGEIIGAGKLATRAVGKGAQLTGRAVAGVARPLERVAGAAERMTAEAIGMTPEGLRTAASTAGIAGALGIAPEAAAFAAIPAGIRTAREAGEALTRAGENLVTQPSRVGPLEAIGAAPGANLRQRMLGVVGQYGGDAALDASLRGLAGGIEGGVIGTGLGYLSGGEEGAAAGLGSGLAQGAAGALGARGLERLTGKAAKEARAGDLGRFIDAQQDPTTKALFERVRDQHGVDTASALMDVEGLVKGRFGDVDVKYLSDTDFVDQYKGRARGVQVEIGDRPTIVINADILGKGKGDSPLYTLGHELFHALEKSEQLAGGATEIKNALVGRWIQEGDVIRKLADGAFNDAEIEARFNEYRDKLSAGSPQRAAELAQFDTINKKADYIASELAAEHFAALIAGQKPDAMLKGFSGLTRQLLDAALTQNASKAIANAAASIERTFGVKPTDSVLFPDLKQASPQVNAMLRDLVRARRKLDEKIMLDDSRGGRVLKPEDISNPLAAKELVNLGLAEQMPDGSIRNLSSEEIRARDDRDVTSLRSIVEKVPGARIVDGEVLGRYSPEQLSAIEQSQTISSRMKDLIRGTNLAIENGNSLFVTYFAALRRVRNKLTKKYSPKYDSGIRVSEREFSPYSFKITKADNPVVNAIDITKVRNELSKLLKKDGSIGGLWSNTDGFMTDLARYFTNLDQREGARRSAEIFGVEKAKFLGDFVGAAEKSGSKFVRSFRLDRVGSMTPMDFKAKFSEEAYQLSKQRWMPAETIGDKSITNSEEGYRIISGAKHKLYGPDGKLIGIYDTQTQAERKADATQARLQPEVDQQQRVPGDEGRQTAEAGGGNRAVGGAEGGQEGRQVDRTVRQAGDVRFMPDGTSDGLAVLDDQLKLELPARPKVLDIANAFQKLFGKAIEYRKAKPQDNAKLVGLLVQEIDRAVKLHPEAKGWYDENVKLTMDVMRELDPDIAKPENDFIFKAILAATSDGNKVGPQFQQTWKEYSNWKNTGEISGEFVSGDRIENIQTNLEMLNEMIKDVGWEKTKDFMVQKGTVKELRQALMDVFGWTKKQAQSIGSSELADEVVPFAVVLGPKLGSFFNNLYGDFSSVTMDRWFMRTLGRLTGTQVAPLAASKLREMRNNLRSAVERLTPSQFERLGIKRSDIRGSAIDDTATTIAGRFAKKDLRTEAKKLSAEGQSALEETRKFANALKKGLNPLVEAPVDGTHRRWIRERIAEVQKELRSRGIELENADLQAVLWYLEKELYEKLKYRSKSGESDYASAASSLYQSVAGRPSDVYAGGTGRVRAIGSTGGSEGMGASQASQTAGPEVGSQRFMPVDENTGLPLNPDKTVTVYHHTNKTAAEAIRRTGVLKSAGEPDVYVTTEKSPTTGYGDEVVAIKVDPKKLQIDDQFPDGRTDFRLSVGKPGGSMNVKVDSNVSFMPSDTDYLSAVKAGDTAAAQRMVDEAAKAAGYTVGPVVHLTNSQDFTVFDLKKTNQGAVWGPAIYAAFKGAGNWDPANLQNARRIEGVVGGRVLDATQPLSSKDALVFKELTGRKVETIPFITLERRFGSVAEGLRALGFSAMIHKGPGSTGRHIAVFDPTQIKSADPITKDNAGNVIPLSQRFQTSSADIRFMPDYSGEHRAPMRDSGAPLDNLKDIYPDDVYGPKGALYYGHASGDATDKAAIRIIQSARNKPDAPVKVFRAIPKDIQSNDINPGDWITTIKSYAVQHGEGALGGDYKILEKTVPAGDLYTNGDSIFEFGYDPKFMPAGSQNVPKHYESVDSFREHWNALGVRNMTDIRAKGTPYEHIRPSEIEVEKANRNKGLGTAFMQDLVAFADLTGKQIRINPSDELGATSKSRLEKFYKRFGFVENKPGKNKDYSISERFYRQPSSGQRFMPTPDSSMPGAYSFTGGYRALPGKSKGSLRLYSPAGSLIGIAASLDEAQRIIRKKAKQ